jgi:Tol biopolymer transport system component
MFDIVRIAAVVVALAVLCAGDALTARGASPSPGRFPTGGLLVFSGSCGCRVGEGLYTIRPHGTRRRSLRNGIGTDHPRWSPDGRWIATDKSSEIVLIAADNSGAEREITRPPDLNAGGADSDPSWAPDGKRLVFVRASADSSVPAAIWSAGVNGRVTRDRLTREAVSLWVRSAF